MNNYVFYVDETSSGERIDKYLTVLLTDKSRSFIQKVIKDGRATVNDKVVKSNYTVNEDDKVCIEIPDPINTSIIPQDIPLDILYEDDDILIVNKPKGMVVHPSAGHYTDTLVNAVMFHCKDNLSGINGVLRPGIVHRIDKDTTGSLIICKNDFTHNHIAEQLKEHSINRTYVAICYGTFKEKSGTIDKPISRHRVDRKKMAIAMPGEGKNAITHYKVLAENDKYSYISCNLETGRTHQIRVHMASINHPILGDEVYSNNKCPYKLAGQTLHAKTIGFIHPRTNEYIEVEAPLPDYFNHLLEINFKDI